MIKGIKLLTEKLPESIESSKDASHGEKMSQDYDSRKDLHSTKFEKRPCIFVKLSFGEMCDSKLPRLHPFDKTIINWVKNMSKPER